jgi:hypothetical protein
VYDQALDGGAASVDISANGKLFAYGTANGTVVVARMPLILSEVKRVENQIVLSWQGGSGRYQLQSCTNLIIGTWQNMGGPTVDTTATNTISGTVFYRVQSLPNP